MFATVAGSRNNRSAVEPQFIRFDDVRPFMLADGVAERPLFGERGMLSPGRDDHRERWTAEA